MERCYSHVFSLILLALHQPKYWYVIKNINRSIRNTSAGNSCWEMRINKNICIMFLERIKIETLWKYFVFGFLFSVTLIKFYDVLSQREVTREQKTRCSHVNGGLTWRGHFSERSHPFSRLWNKNLNLVWVHCGFLWEVTVAGWGGRMLKKIYLYGKITLTSSLEGKECSRGVGFS